MDLIAMRAYYYEKEISLQWHSEEPEFQDLACIESMAYENRRSIPGLEPQTDVKKKCVANKSMESASHIQMWVLSKYSHRESQ